MKPSQEDVIAENTRLTGDLATAQSNLTAAHSDITRLTGERDNAVANLATVTKERDDARAEAAKAKADLAAVTSERDKLAGESRDFERRLATELSRHGIRKEGVAQGAAAGSLDLVAQYQAITDPKEKAAFVAKHEKELRSLIKQA